MKLLEMRVAPNPRSVRTVRDQLIRIGTEMRMSTEGVEDFVTAVGEAFANAIEHAGCTEAIEIQVDLQDDDVVAIVRDHGRGIDPGNIPPQLPPATKERGRGIALMRSCSSSLSITNPPDGGTRIAIGWETRQLAVSDRPAVTHCVH